MDKFKLRYSLTLVVFIGLPSILIVGGAVPLYSNRGSRQVNVDIGGGGSSGSGSSSGSVTVTQGYGCGTIPVKRNQIIEVNSTNFRVGNYFNNEACTWIFTSEECTLSVFCPCFSIPNSLGCLEDYLKIGYLHFHDKFCGDNPPIGVYRATGSTLTLRFRSDYKGTGRGFLCHIRCTEVGRADPVAPTPVTCPSGTRNPYAGTK